MTYVYNYLYKIKVCVCVCVNCGIGFNLTLMNTYIFNILDIVLGRKVGTLDIN